MMLYCVWSGGGEWQAVVLPAIKEGRPCTWRDVEGAGIERAVALTEFEAWGLTATGPGEREAEISN